MPGGYTMPGGAEIDVGLFTKITQGWKPPPPAKPVWMMATHATADSEPNVIGAYALELHFTVLTKPYTPREFSQILPLRETVLGTSPTKLMLRAMVDSALGLDPNDTRVESEAKRALRGFRDLDGIDFVAKIGEDGDGGNYLAQVITPGQPEWTQFHTAPITDAQRECMEAWNRVAACSVAV